MKCVICDEPGLEFIEEFEYTERSEVIGLHQNELAVTEPHHTFKRSIKSYYACCLCGAEFTDEELIDFLEYDNDLD